MRFPPFTQLRVLGKGTRTKRKHADLKLRNAHQERERASRDEFICWLIIKQVLLLPNGKTKDRIAKYLELLDVLHNTRQKLFV